MRIVGGTFKGRRLSSGLPEHVRPTTDKVREAMFSALLSMAELRDKRVLDLFAGSGALGIEALSREAAFCLFVEKDRKVSQKLKATLRELAIEAQSQICSVAVEKFLGNPESALKWGQGEASFDLVFADPPYDIFSGAELLKRLAGSGLLAPGAVIVLESRESDSGDDASAWAAGLPFDLLKTKTYGSTAVAYFKACNQR